MTDADELRTRLVAGLIREGRLRTLEWQAAFAAVPRHLFLPRFFALTPDRSRYEAVDADRPDWLGLVYRDAVWPTQLDGDDSRWDEARRQGPITGTPTCSSTQPSLMAVMLETLDVHDGHRVLEIGTGTGYNAALLAHRLDDDQVVSVDVDTSLVAQARENLARAGYAPTVVAVDGAEGYPAGAPYDRLIATCSVTSVPPAWLAQVRPGGVILANVYRHLVGDALVRLTVDADGSATGRLLGDPGGFMPLRAHQNTEPWELIRAVSGQDGEKRESNLPTPVDDGEAWVVLADLLMPDTAWIDISRDDGDVQWLVHPDGSWAYYELVVGQVEQGGPRRLWDELERVHQLWSGNGRPPRDQIGVTVASDGEQHVWLHDGTVIR